MPDTPKNADDGIWASARLGADPHTAQTVGEFFIAFAQCEHLITAELAAAVQARDAAAFELIARGMDARVKCERLKRAMGTYLNVGPIFKEQLAFFEDSAIKQRNELAHKPIMPIIPGASPPRPENPHRFMSLSETGWSRMRTVDLDWIAAVADWMRFWYLDWGLIGSKSQHETGILETSGRRPIPQRASNSGQPRPIPASKKHKQP